MLHHTKMFKLKKKVFKVNHESLTTSPKFANFPPTRKIFSTSRLSPPKKEIFILSYYITVSMLWPNKNLILSCGNSCCTIFILQILVYTGHANFDFSLSSICAECCFYYLLKCFKWSKTLFVIFLPPDKIFLLQNFSLPQLERRPYPLMSFQNQWISNLHKKRTFGGKLTNISITFVCCFPAY